MLDVMYLYLVTQSPTRHYWAVAAYTPDGFTSYPSQKVARRHNPGLVRIVNISEPEFLKLARKEGLDANKSANWY